MKICFVAPLPPPYGGIANWTKMLCEYIKKQYSDEVQHTIIDISPKCGIAEGRSVFNRIFTSGRNMISQNYKLHKMLKMKATDVIHMTTSGSLALIRDRLLIHTANRYKIPVVYHIHFGRIPEIQKKNNWEWKLIQSVLKRVTNIIAIDKNTMCALKNDNESKLYYIPNPICINQLPLRTKKTEKVVMYLGWVIREKGIEELLQAWTRAYKQHKDWNLWIVGPYNETYLQALKQKYALENVEFMGEKSHDRAMELLNRASIFVLPSYTEACPYVIMEAMALGKVIIASDVGNIPEMLSEDCGLLVEAKNSCQLFDAFNQVIEKKVDTQTLQEHAILKATQLYDIKYIMERYIECWKESENHR